MDIQGKLLTFEKYLRRQSFNSYVKGKVIYRFHEIFRDEMAGTKSGDKWRKRNE